MLKFFPVPYPDEILYSVFARYKIRSGNTSPKDILRELFGNVNVSAAIEFPSNLDSLVNNLYEFKNYTTEDFIYNNTLYPLFEPFIPQNRAKQILSSMKGANGGNINTRIGTMASSIKNPRFLRFCPKCFEEDKKKFGEAYWHRVHQIPGAVLCPKHDIFVLDSGILRHNLNKHEYIAANEDNCKVHEVNTFYSEKEINQLKVISKNIEWVLNSKLASGDINSLYEGYLNIIIGNGLASPKGRIYQSELINNFLEFYDNNFLHLMQSDIDPNMNDNWVSMMVRKHRKAFHPLRHILFMNYLGMTPKEFFKDDCTYKPFGNPPWPCLNKASDHYHEKCITDITITYDGKIKQPVGTFKCNCGFIYSRRGPDKAEEDRYRIGRIKEFGLVWKRRLEELYSKNLSFREIARQLNVDTNTVIKYSCNNICTKDKEGVKLNVLTNNDVNKERYRKNWLQLQQSNNNLNKTQLRHLDKSTYIWLYRHDKKWLDKNSPGNKSNININKRIDWNQRDIEILDIVKSVVNEMLRRYERPERVTVSRIGKKTGLQALLEKHIDKLPETQKYLNSVVEDVEAFQIRRVKWAAEELNSKGKIPLKWSILRKAGIRQNCSINVQNAIDNEIKLYNNNEKVR